jgi:hypothetical protein
MPYSFPDTIVKNPLTMLTFYDESIQLGAATLGKEGTVLNKWQKEMLLYLGKEHKKDDAAIMAQLLAANGSGKTKYILAPFAIWMAMRYSTSLTVITTASGKQLDEQALLFCTRLANSINLFHKGEFPEDVFTCQYRKIICNLNDSRINFFATDDVGKAEGWHPITDSGKFAIIVDEGKTVTDGIYEAIENCIGFTHRIDISSAGSSNGQFHGNWNNHELDGIIFKKRVTAFDCGHIKQQDIETRIKKYGLHHPRIRNSVFSEFTSADEQVVITRELLIKSASLCSRFYDFGPLRAGLDLAAGGDENSISVWRGNKEIASKHWVKKDTVEAVNDIILFLKSFKGELKEENIYADDGGVGRPMLDILKHSGFNVNRVWNQSRAFDFTHYANKATEYWWNFKRFIEEYQVLFLKNEKGDIDPTLLTQLSNRYYKQQDSSGKVILESKQKAKSEGHPSPDRADAVILAWSPLIYPVEEMSGAVSLVHKGPSSIEEFMEQERFKEMSEIRNGGTSKINLLPAEYTEMQMRAINSLSYRNIFKDKSFTKK